MRHAVLWVVAVLATSPPATAQRQPPLPSLPVQSAAFRPGTWVRYAITRPGTGQAVLVRMAALEMEKGAQWFELSFTDSERRTLTVKVLVQGTLQSPRRVLRAVVQPQGQQALELPEKMAGAQLPAFRRDPGKDASAVKVGKAKLTVPAGSFVADRYRLSDKGRTVEMWTSTKVAGWPLVKMQSQDLLLELVAYGTGAASQIRGKPAKLDERWLGGGK